MEWEIGDCVFHDDILSIPEISRCDVTAIFRTLFDKRESEKKFLTTFSILRRKFNIVITAIFQNKYFQSTRIFVHFANEHYWNSHEIGMYFCEIMKRYPSLNSTQYDQCNGWNGYYHDQKIPQKSGNGYCKPCHGICTRKYVNEMQFGNFIEEI